MTNIDKLRLSRRIERGLHKLFLQQKHAQCQANKFQRQADYFRSLRSLLLDAKKQLWNKEV